MSVRAYRVEEIKCADGSSFNLWHDTAITEWLGANTGFFEELNMDANGIASVSVEDLERMVKELEGKNAEPKSLDPIRADIAWAKANGNDWIEYDCF